jgi:hypothetical protein
VELDKNIKQQLAELIAAPNKACLQQTALLNSLLQRYPYYQPLHLLQAKANLQAEDVSTLARTSLYTNGTLLHHFLFKKEYTKGSFKVISKQAQEDEPVSLEEQLVMVEDEPVNEPEETVQQEQYAVVPVADEQEVYEEIAEVDINNYRPFRNSSGNDLPQNKPQEEELVSRRNSLEDDFVFESIASSDFFAFEQSFSPETAATPEQPVPAPYIEEHNDRAAEEFVRSQVSNYHDDKLPYTFLWWLDKTRKEHQSTFQPYAVPKKTNSPELQQQYVEHIFHIQSPLTVTEELPLPEGEPKPVIRDFELIDSFIKNDPQITPPNAEQIDNENKAKKSAEDQNDLVSETLAGIYIEQMLYDKAIDTYEKLSLKFPEKSRYFADLIQSIEKKI